MIVLWVVMSIRKYFNLAPAVSVFLSLSLSLSLSPFY
jgi:hypothetical protein